MAFNYDALKVKHVVRFFLENICSDAMMEETQPYWSTITEKDIESGWRKLHPAGKITRMHFSNTTAFLYK